MGVGPVRAEAEVVHPGRDRTDRGAHGQAGSTRGQPDGGEPEDGQHPLGDGADRPDLGVEEPVESLLLGDEAEGRRDVPGFRSIQVKHWFRGGHRT